MKLSSPFADLTIPTSLAAYLIFVWCLWISFFPQISALAVNTLQKTESNNILRNYFAVLLLTRSVLSDVYLFLSLCKSSFVGFLQFVFLHLLWFPFQFDQLSVDWFNFRLLLLFIDYSWWWRNKWSEADSWH